jgi:hypothetical protein
LDTREWSSDWLGFDGTDDLFVDVQQVVGTAVVLGHDDFAHGVSSMVDEVNTVSVADIPTGLR